MSNVRESWSVEAAKVWAARIRLSHLDINYHIDGVPIQGPEEAQSWIAPLEYQQEYLELSRKLDL